MLKPILCVVAAMLLGFLVSVSVKGGCQRNAAPMLMLVDRVCPKCGTTNRVEPEDFLWKCRGCGSRHVLRVKAHEIVPLDADATVE